MKTYKITISGKEIEVTQNEDGSFNKPDIVKELEPIGTALKPAFEPICMAMKPLSEKNYVANVLKYGTGGINIDESRVGTDKIMIRGGGNITEDGEKTFFPSNEINEERTGRFPANLIHDNSEEVRECFPETNPSRKAKRGIQSKGYSAGIEWEKASEETNTERGIDDNGGNASRFFKSIIYQAKASKSERNKGCEGLEEKPAYKFDGGDKLNQWTGKLEQEQKMSNNHPTVKPIALMEYLIKMVTKPGGIVLDPFAGSGSTLVAAKQNGFQYIGIEMTEEYIPIINARLGL